MDGESKIPVIFHERVIKTRWSNGAYTCAVGPNPNFREEPKYLKEADEKELSYHDKIKAEVDEFRAAKEQEIVVFEQETIKKHKDCQTEDLKACNHYIEVIDMLISDEEKTLQETVAEETPAETTEEVV